MLVSFVTDLSCVSLVGLLLQHLAPIMCLQYSSVTLERWDLTQPGTECVFSLLLQACYGETKFSAGYWTHISLGCL